VFAAAEERVTELAEQGYTVVPDALDPGLVARLSAALDRALERYPDRIRAEPEKRRSQLYGIPALDPVFVEPLLQPTTMPIVCTFLGWNIHLHHSHADLTRPLPPGERSSYRWHRDMQSTTYTLPPPLPLLSIKVGYFLTDVTTPDRGSVLVIPGSHRTDQLQRAEDFAQDQPTAAMDRALERYPDRIRAEPEKRRSQLYGIRAEDFAQDQPTAVPVLAPAGSALLLDARTWHSVGKNFSAVERRMAYYAYTYRWIRPSEDVDLPADRLAELTPVQRQLLGAATSTQGFHFPRAEDVPLRELVRASPIRPRTLEAELTA
jgi:ectoine hydroxylase-related dioxygenase (phytanoyl-CoA dioxygenase family)